MSSSNETKVQACKCVDDIMDKNGKSLSTSGKKSKKHCAVAGLSKQERAQISHRSDSVLNSHDELRAENEGIKDLSQAKDMIRRLAIQRGGNVTATKSHFQLSSTAYGVRMLSRDISNTKVELEVENLLIVTKKHDNSLIYLTRE